MFLCIYVRENYKINNKEKRKNVLEIVKRFIQHHVRIRIRNEDKRTPLEEAVTYVSIIFL